jgi:hypothetical protein
VDTITGWVEDIPSTEHAREVVQVLITEIVPHFGLLKSLQRDNRPPFKVKITQKLYRELGIKYYVPCVCHAQLCGKIAKTNDILKRHLAKLAQETHSPWTKLLPIALIRLRNTPGKQQLNSFESLYSSPFLTNDLFLDEETAQLISHVTQLAKFQQTLSEIKQAIPRKDKKRTPCLLPW